jgi:hypothetical protein
VQIAVTSTPGIARQAGRCAKPPQAALMIPTRKVIGSPRLLDRSENRADLIDLADWAMICSVPLAGASTSLVDLSASSRIERLAFGHLGAVLDQPFGDLGFRHRKAELGKQDVGGHGLAVFPWTG